MNRSLLLYVLVAVACSESGRYPRSKADASTTDGAADSASRGGSRGSGGSAATAGSAGTSATGGSDGVRGGSSDASSDGAATDAASDGARGDSGLDGGTEGGGARVIDVGASVLERNNHPNRDGAFIEPALTRAVAAQIVRDPNFNPTFTGAMHAAPLYWEKGPGGKGLFYAATTTNDVFALDETTGAIVWQKNIGPSPTANGVPCGNIHPLGIISTPVIDPITETIYVAGAIGTSSIERHEVHALSIMDGTERPGFPVVIKGTSGGITFTAPPQNQRSALSLVNGILYVAYGGHAGDCGPYHGWVFGIDTKDPSKMGGWATLGQGEGIWATGGMVAARDGVFAITGNSTAGATDHMTSDSEQVVHITGLGVLNRVNKNLFFPANWHTMDSTDADYGSNSPVYVSVPGSTPENVLVTFSKDGHLYMLDPENLGGMGGALVDFTVAAAASGTSAGSVLGAPATYRSSTGVHVLFTTAANALCPPGGSSGRVLMSVLMSPGSPPKPKVEWCALSPGTLGAPMVTTTDGSANSVIWYVAASLLLEGFDGDTGALVYQGSVQQSGCDGVGEWAAPIAVKNRIIVGGDGHLCGWMVPH